MGWNDDALTAALKMYAERMEEAIKADTPLLLPCSGCGKPTIACNCPARQARRALGLRPVEDLPPPERAVDRNRSCDGCRWALLVDYGWSNYTVEGTEVYCSVGGPLENGTDRFYRENPKLAEAASRCPAYSAGDPEEVDVDRETYESLPDHFKAFFDAVVN